MAYSSLFEQLYIKYHLEPLIERVLWETQSQLPKLVDYADKDTTNPDIFD